MIHECPPVSPSDQDYLDGDPNWGEFGQQGDHSGSTPRDHGTTGAPTNLPLDTDLYEHIEGARVASWMDEDVLTNRRGKRPASTDVCAEEGAERTGSSNRRRWNRRDDTVPDELDRLLTDVSCCSLMDACSVFTAHTSCRLRA